MNIYLNVLHTTINWYLFSDKPEKNKNMQETKNPCDDFVDNIGNTVKYFAGTFGKVYILQHYLDFKLFQTIILLTTTIFPGFSNEYLFERLPVSYI